MVTINPADCPNTCVVRIDRADDGLLSAVLEREVFALDGKRYLRVSKQLAGSQTFDVCRMYLAAAGWEMEHVANIRFFLDQLWVLRKADDGQ